MANICDTQYKVMGERKAVARPLEHAPNNGGEHQERISLQVGGTLWHRLREDGHIGKRTYLLGRV